MVMEVNVRLDVEVHDLVPSSLLREVVQRAALHRRTIGRTKAEGNRISPTDSAGARRGHLPSFFRAHARPAKLTQDAPELLMSTSSFVSLSLMIFASASQPALSLRSAWMCTHDPPDDLPSWFSWADAASS